MNKRPRHELPVIPTANLVDIAILLIIFYMACSNFVSQPTASLTLPRSPDIDKLNEPLVLVTVDSAGAIRVQGRPAAGPADVESRVAALVRGQASEEKRRVMFRCDAGVRQDVFGPVLEAIVEAGGIVTAVGEKTPAR